MTSQTKPAPSEPRQVARRSAGRHARAAEHAVNATGVRLHVTVAGTAVDVRLPPADKLAFYAGVLAVAAVGIIEWPIAAITCVGHLLSEDRHNRALRALGEALDAAAAA